MRKTWARLAIIVAVVCAAGFGWVYHQHGSASTHWLEGLANETATSDNSIAWTNTSSKDSSNSQPTSGNLIAADQTGNQSMNSENSSAATNAGQSLNNTTTNPTNTTESNAARTGVASTKSDSAGTTDGSNSTSGSVKNPDTTNTATSTDTSKTSNAPANSTVSNATNSTGASNPTQSSGSFTIIVSENHGQTVIDKKVVSIHQGENLMEYMQQNFTITTAYGGGFIVSIDGIKSQWTGVPVDQRKPVDWFLYINQQQAPVGAENIIPRKGDVDDWDYHSWNPSTGQG